MAYEVSDGAILQVTFDMRQDGQQVMNVFCFKLTADDPIDGLAAIVVARDAIDGGFGTMWPKYLDCLADDVNQGRIFLQWITPTRYSAYIHTPLNRTGEKDGTPLPVNCATVFQRNGDGTTKHDRSITHLGGMISDDVSDSIIQEGQRLLVAGFAESACSEITVGFGALLKPCAFNRANPAGSTVLTTSLVRDTSRVMRRRTVRVGS